MDWAGLFTLIYPVSLVTSKRGKMVYPITKKLHSRFDLALSIPIDSLSVCPITYPRDMAAPIIKPFSTWIWPRPNPYNPFYQLSQEKKQGPFRQLLSLPRGKLEPNNGGLIMQTLAPGRAALEISRQYIRESLRPRALLWKGFNQLNPA